MSEVKGEEFIEIKFSSPIELHAVESMNEVQFQVLRRVAKERDEQKKIVAVCMEALADIRDEIGGEYFARKLEEKLTTILKRVENYMQDLQ